MQAGAHRPRRERAAISEAVQYFEERAFQVTGVRDMPQAEFGAAQQKGQMDCVDESTNTHALLVYLAERGLLKFHKVERKATPRLLPRRPLSALDGGRSAIQAAPNGWSIPGMRRWAALPTSFPLQTVEGARQFWRAARSILIGRPTSQECAP